MHCALLFILNERARSRIRKTILLFLENAKLPTWKNQSELRKSEKAKNRQKSKNAIFRKMNADALNLDELDYDDEDESHNLKNALPVVDLLEDESDGRKRSNEESENQRNRPNSDEEEEEEEGALSDDSDDGEIKSGKKHSFFPFWNG